MKILHVDNNEAAEIYNSLIHNTPAIVLFYMPGCGHCEAMKDDWTKFEDQVSNLDDNILISKVRNDYINNIEGSKDIMGFPTIFKMNNGEKIEEFDNDRTTSNFINFMETLKTKSMKGGKKNTKRIKKSRKSKKSKKTRKSKKSRKTRKHYKKIK